MPIRVKLDHLMLDRRMTLTELASRVDLTLANLSIVSRPARAAHRVRTTQYRFKIAAGRRELVSRLRFTFARRSHNRDSEKHDLPLVQQGRGGGRALLRGQLSRQQGDRRSPCAR